MLLLGAALPRAGGPLLTLPEADDLGGEFAGAEDGCVGGVPWVMEAFALCVPVDGPRVLSVFCGAAPWRRRNAASSAI